MISDMLEQIQLMKQADEVKLARVTEQFIAAMGVIAAMREWASKPSAISVQALRQAEHRLDEVLSNDAGTEDRDTGADLGRVYRTVRSSAEIQGTVSL
jgi:hypothetical protein